MVLFFYIFLHSLYDKITQGCSLLGKGYTSMILPRGKVPTQILLSTFITLLALILHLNLRTSSHDNVIVAVTTFLGSWSLLSYYTLRKERQVHQGHIRAMRVLLQQNPPLNQTVDYSRDALLVIDTHLKVIDVSPHVCEILGMPESSLLGKPLQDYFQIPNLSSSSGTLNGELTWKKTDGKMIYLDYRIRSLLDHGSRSGRLLILTDISNEKRRDEAYLQAAKFSAVGQVAAGLAHELRNPLTTIKGFIQLIGSEQFPPAYRPYHQLILDEIQTTDELLRNFLLLTNPTAPHFRSLNPEELVHSVVQILHPTCLMKEVTLHVSATPPISPILGDEEQLIQVLLAVTQNAIEASPAKGQIHISLDEHLDYLQVKVIDFGDGIPTDIRPYILDPFFTTRKDGTGLGLTIAQRILLAHHGELVFIDSEPSGTAVLLSIPLIRGVA